MPTLATGANLVERRKRAGRVDTAAPGVSAAAAVWASSDAAAGGAVDVALARVALARVVAAAAPVVLTRPFGVAAALGRPFVAVAARAGAVAGTLARVSGADAALGRPLGRPPAAVAVPLPAGRAAVGRPLGRPVVAVAVPLAEALARVALARAFVGARLRRPVGRETLR